MADSAKNRPRVGLPWRSWSNQQAAKRDAYDKYLRAVEAAGGEPVEVSLDLGRAAMEKLCATLDAVVLPGSGADVDPQWYHAERHAKCNPADPRREQTDFALLDFAFAARKPVLAICYGVQSLNVHRGGTLVQDIAAQWDTPLRHNYDSQAGEAEPFHPVCIEAGTELARLAAAAEPQVNSSHHQAIERAGRGLRVTAHAPDGVIEAVELADMSGAGQWVVGVQWHPERMPADALTQALFGALVAAARRVAA